MYQYTNYYTRIDCSACGVSGKNRQWKETLTGVLDLIGIFFDSAITTKEPYTNINAYQQALDNALFYLNPRKEIQIGIYIT